MFEKKTKKPLDFKGPKNTTFGNDSDDEEIQTDGVPDVTDFMKAMDGEIKNAKQHEKNSTIAKIYSSSSSTTKVKQSINACGCFGS